MRSTTQRSLKLARDLGWHVEVVEKWIVIPGIPGGGKRRDLYGAVDIMGIRQGYAGTFGIQSCAGQGALAKHKVTALESKPLVLYASTNRFEIWSWDKRGPRGKRKVYTVKRWRLHLRSVADGGSWWEDVSDEPI